MASPTFTARAALTAGRALCVLGAVFAGSAAGASERHVEVIFSSDPSDPAAVAALTEVNARLADRFDLHVMFLNSDRRRADDASTHLSERMRGEHANEAAPALVIAFEDEALTFVEQGRESIFAGAPVVFAGVKSLKRARAASRRPGMVGMVEELAIAETIDLARRLHPTPLKRMVVVTDDTLAAQSLDMRVTEIEGAFPDLAFERLSFGELSYDEAARRLRRDLRSDAAYLYLGARRDANGAQKSDRAALRYLERQLHRPLYGLTEPAVRLAAAAGRVVSAEAEARRAVDLALRVLGGETIGQTAPRTEEARVTLVDEMRAKRFHLRLDHLAPSARRLREAPSFWRESDALAKLALLLTGASAAILGALLLVSRGFRRRLRLAHDALRSRHAELSDAKREIERRSLHDPLTDLPNRRFLEKRLAEISESAGGEAGVWAMLHLDLDRFKLINDTFGPLAGDRVLRTVADRLRRSAPERCFLARGGADEFFCIGQFANRAEIEAFAERLRRALSALVDHQGRPLRFGVSIGVATAAEGGAPFSPHALLQQANIALYRAKAEGRGRVAFFSRDHAAEIIRCKELEDDVARGLEADEFEPWYQPQVCAATGAAVGIEALARWRHPRRGVLAPGAFLEAIERLGASAAFDSRMLRHVARDVAAWRADGLTPPSLSVNISPRRLLEPGLAEEIAACDFGETRLGCELLESIFLDGGDPELDWAIDRLRETGVAIEIDDFGTGHASIVSLLSLQPDRLKIARELIAPIDLCETRLGLVRAIMDIAKPLGIKVVAEGVERPEHIRLLRELGCERLQGMAISPPRPREEIPGFFRARAHSAA